MCGFAGVIGGGYSAVVRSRQLAEMLATISHRGPDDEGIWIDEVAQLALGHRRLSVLDLSIAGHQPMISGSGRFVIIFNGEIYNHLLLRPMLGANVRWRGHSDTETLLECLESWGLRRTLEAAVGMFALAVWDRWDRTLFLARDRVGEKPLYYGWQDGHFLFGSELKALRAHPAFSAVVDWSAVSTFLRRNYVPAPSTIYQGIFKLQPGTLLTLTEADRVRHLSPEPEAYWSMGEVALNGLEEPFKGTFGDAVDELQDLLAEAVRIQSVADVPVGAFLSGGVDSSAVTAVMNRISPGNVTTFSVGMPDRVMDESTHAASVARHLGTRHIAHVIQPKEALDLIPRINQIWDEPFADSSQLPMLLLSSIARESVTVALSGDGGDEFFLGYSQYLFYQRLWRYRGLGAFPWKAMLSPLGVMQSNPAVDRFSRRARAIYSAWRQPDGQQLNAFWMDAYRGGPVPIRTQAGVQLNEAPLLRDVASSAGLYDSVTYLPDDILVKVDRASMACSLEVRAPLLDHRIIEFAYKLPLEFKIHRGIGKRVLREVLYREVPRHLVDRPKMGFSIPLAGWLRNELRDWAESLISSIPLNHPQFDRASIDGMWNEHLAGRDRTSQLWAVLVLTGFLDLKSPEVSTS
jgi:asparagine synthase (glutamine-hydrolysing)